MEIVLPDFDDRLYLGAIFYYSQSAFTNKTACHKYNRTIVESGVKNHNPLAFTKKC